VLEHRDRLMRFGAEYVEAALEGRFAHFTDDDIEYFQSKIDEMWNKWLIPRIIPLRKEIESDNSPAI
jgi:hypothetical protein